MRGTSRASLDAAEDRFEQVLRAAGAKASVLGEQLMAVVDALDHSGSLRRTLADPSVPAEPKGAVVAQILAGAEPETITTVQGLVGSRWSADSDLADAVERLAFNAWLADAENRAALDRVENELFMLGRGLVGEREVRQTLFDDRIPGSARASLVDKILAGRADPVTDAIARRAAAAPRGRRYVATLGHAGDLIAERRRRQVATVTAAAPLTEAQRERLGSILERAYGREVQINEIHDAQVLGGLRIQVGPNVVDSTVLARLADARRRVAS
ncbi:F0F1 ATP synthase subunit delta [Cellulomonas sp. JH27-2]|uniref:F0F1 ATP synthase subunit delta n=1 Tax=Cellulomonas sp. JH27-2 TaxID=2774139 RepID=UPI001786B5E7|nr:F0F1 ATP synthase subunit delta [Cellulomonas sp. JH27-2]MBD8059819.1 F0F1 ATP synthase subunit delta [Cellulomonas sp. JH27-2]